MTLIEKLNSYCPLIESPEPVTYSVGEFLVLESLDIGIYSLLVMYQNNFLCQRGTFRRAGCVEYKKKRQKYIADLEIELIKLGINY